VKTENFFFAAPDNGLLWETLKEQKIVEIKQILVPEDASRTFHGRDVFAKVAANIDLGNFAGMGEKVEDIKKLELYLNQREGIVVRIDRFGNIITNIPKSDKDKYSVRITGKNYVMRYCPDYNSAKDDELLLIEGSSRTLEISLKNGSANDRLNLKVGERITIS
jgi:hypothetical protein